MHTKSEMSGEKIPLKQKFERGIYFCDLFIYKTD